MTSSTPALTLPNGVVLPPAQVEGLLWGGREQGMRWLQALPATLTDICARNGITLSTELPNMRMNLVLFGESVELEPVVLKLSPYDEIAPELGMAAYVSGRGYPRVYDHNLRDGWIVMERISPGITLQQLAERNAIADADATQIAAELLLRTTMPAPSAGEVQFPNLPRWLRSLFAYARTAEDGPMPLDQVARAIDHAEWLLHLPAEQQLLHGDFHHGNIIQGEQGWMLIDPKGVVAPLAFEVGPWFYNPLDLSRQPDLPTLFDRRLQIFAETLGIDRITLWRAAYVAAVLSDCWTLESGTVEDTHFRTITTSLLQLPESSATS